MNRLVASGQLEGMPCGVNYAYILSDSSLFLPTEYKVLRSQTGSGFVRCMKMLYNGKLQMYYFTENLKSLASMQHCLDSDSFLTIVANLFADIVAVDHNGFLSCRNIDISLDRIYVDPATCKVQLIYLPISQRLFEDRASFEKSLRGDLIRLITNTPAVSSPLTHQLAADLTNSNCSLAEMCSKLRQTHTERFGDCATVYIAPPKETVVRLMALNGPANLQMVINKDSFVIGKSETVDGTISYNRMISRAHCRINKDGSLVTITDLQSSNGTYVNQTKLQPNQPCQLQNGDIIRLANSDFQVSIV